MCKKVYNKPSIEFYYFDTDILSASDETWIGEEDGWSIFVPFH